MLPLGELCRAHGIRGEIKLSTNLPPKFFSEVSVVVYGGKEFAVEFLRSVNGGAFIKLQGVDTPEAANAMRGTVFFPEGFRPELDDGEFFWDDLKGLTCELGDGCAIGTVTDINLNTPTPVITVRRCPGGSFPLSAGSETVPGKAPRAGNSRSDILFPAVKGLIKDISAENGRLILDAELFKRVAVYED